MPRTPPPLDKEPPEVPEVESAPRTPKRQRLEHKIQSIYIMLGGAMAVVPPQMAGERLRLIGRSFSLHSADIAEAWINLCEEDKRVERMWESLTGFSAWGEVVGRHLEAIGDETPAMQGRRQERQPQPQQQPQPEGDELRAMQTIAEWFTQQQAAQRQQQPQPNGPPPTPSPEVVRRMMQEEQRQQQRPQRQQQQQPVAQVPPDQAPPMGQSRRPVGMPTPADLGVVVPDQPEDFPSSGPENVRG